MERFSKQMRFHEDVTAAMLNIRYEYTQYTTVYQVAMWMELLVEYYTWISSSPQLYRAL